MTNYLESAKAALEAEIAHAKQGVAHFSTRVEALEKTLLHIVAVDGGVLDVERAEAAASIKGAKKSKPETVKPIKPVKKVRTPRAAKGDGGLPFTGGNYWYGLVTVEPQSATEILQKAIGKLGFAPDKDQIRKLSFRQTFALNEMVNLRRIKDSGTGRERRFFKT